MTTVDSTTTGRRQDEAADVLRRALATVANDLLLGLHDALGRAGAQMDTGQAELDAIERFLEQNRRRGGASTSTSGDLQTRSRVDFFLTHCTDNVPHAVDTISNHLRAGIDASRGALVSLRDVLLQVVIAVNGATTTTTRDSPTDDDNSNHEHAVLSRSMPTAARLVDGTSALTTMLPPVPRVSTSPPHLRPSYDAVSCRSASVIRDSAAAEQQQQLEAHLVRKLSDAEASLVASRAESDALREAAVRWAYQAAALRQGAVECSSRMRRLRDAALFSLRSAAEARLRTSYFGQWSRRRLVPLTPSAASATPPPPPPPPPPLVDASTSTAEGKENDRRLEQSLSDLRIQLETAAAQQHREVTVLTAEREAMAQECARLSRLVEVQQQFLGQERRETASFIQFASAALHSSMVSAHRALQWERHKADEVLRLCLTINAESVRCITRLRRVGQLREVSRTRDGLASYYYYSRWRLAAALHRDASSHQPQGADAATSCTALPMIDAACGPSSHAESGHDRNSPSEQCSEALIQRCADRERELVRGIEAEEHDLRDALLVWVEQMHQELAAALQTYRTEFDALRHENRWLRSAERIARDAAESPSSPRVRSASIASGGGGGGLASSSVVSPNMTLLRSTPHASHLTTDTLALGESDILPSVEGKRGIAVSGRLRLQPPPPLSAAKWPRGGLAAADSEAELSSIDGGAYPHSHDDDHDDEQGGAARGNTGVYRSHDASPSRTEPAHHHNDNMARHLLALSSLHVEHAMEQGELFIQSCVGASVGALLYAEHTKTVREAEEQHATLLLGVAEETRLVMRREELRREHGRLAAACELDEANERFIMAVSYYAAERRLSNHSSHQQQQQWHLQTEWMESRIREHSDELFQRDGLLLASLHTALRWASTRIASTEELVLQRTATSADFIVTVTALARHETLSHSIQQQDVREYCAETLEEARLASSALCLDLLGNLENQWNDFIADAQCRSCEAMERLQVDYLERCGAMWVTWVDAAASDAHKRAVSDAYSSSKAELLEGRLAVAEQTSAAASSAASVQVAEARSRVLELHQDLLMNAIAYSTLGKWRAYASNRRAWRAAYRVNAHVVEQYNALLHLADAKCLDVMMGLFASLEQKGEAQEGVKPSSSSPAVAAAVVEAVWAFSERHLDHVVSLAERRVDIVIDYLHLEQLVLAEQQHRTALEKEEHIEAEAQARRACLEEWLTFARARDAELLMQCGRASSLEDFEAFCRRVDALGQQTERVGAQATRALERVAEVHRRAEACTRPDCSCQWPTEDF